MRGNTIKGCVCVCKTEITNKFRRVIRSQKKIPAYNAIYKKHDFEQCEVIKLKNDFLELELK